MLKIYLNTIVYIACPANLSTGGPTLLHQLAVKLIKKGIVAKMYYVDVENGDPVHPDYKKFSVDYVYKIEDNSQNVLIIPEALTNIYYNYKKVRSVFWWLSVNNYTSQFVGKKKFIKNLLNYHKVYRVSNDTNRNNIHWAQSYYAIDFLKKNKRNNVYLLSDYLDESFMIKTESIKLSDKLNRVLYNPKKGFEFTEKLINLSPDLEWIPIENMSPEEVATLLSISKVYIDFGTHPGKDRFPREAAICKCCVLTGKRGAANFKEDVPIHADYKFDDIDENIPLILSKIRWCIDNYEKAIEDFKAYCDVIKKEEQVFDKQLDNLLLLIKE